MNDRPDWISAPAGALRGEIIVPGDKSVTHRALMLGAIALWIGVAGLLPAWAAWLFPALCALTAWTIVRRVRNGLREAH